ncbi:MAG TPA: GntR family transcriptional regulator [Longimicrobiales bacterium]|nr:GntR family transcriptional regulator [Longimicrobiales bacterium]
MTPVELTDSIRRRIVADVHLGRIKPGGRLSSLRMVASEFSVSIRAAARAYSELEKEGLVNVRGRSGIYLVLAPAMEIELAEPLDWYADMLRDAWSHRLTVTDVNAILQQLVLNPLRAACVESTEDHMVAFCAELEADFALKTKSVVLTPEGARADDEIVTLYDALSDVDFVVTTAFHAAEVRLAADQLQKPVVIVSVNDTLVSALETELQRGPVTIVGLDGAFVDRFREYLIERFRANGDMRVTCMDDVAQTNGNGATTTLYTRAARQRLNEEEYHLLPPPIPFLSANAARRVVQCMLSALGKRALQAA